MSAPTFTASEKDALKVMLLSAEGNGHDFGFVEDVVDHVGHPFVAGGIITSLIKKGVVRVWEPVETETGVWTQFTWKMPVDEIKKAVV